MRGIKQTLAAVVTAAALAGCAQEESDLSEASFGKGEPTPAEAKADPTPSYQIAALNEVYNENFTLSSGHSHGDQLSLSVQQEINKIGLDSLVEDGKFGPATQAAVQNFQEFIAASYQNFEIRTDGVVDRSTIIALEHCINNAEQTAELVGQHHERIAIARWADPRVAQEGLNDMGLANLRVDGVFGTRSQEALARFQNLVRTNYPGYEINNDGELDHSTQVALRHFERNPDRLDAAIQNYRNFLAQEIPGMGVSQACIDLMCFKEGLERTAEPCPAGVLTIGYGHTRGVTEGMTCTIEQARTWLAEDLQVAVSDLQRNLSEQAYSGLTQGQKDALTSFCFNIGGTRFGKSSVCNLLNEGKVDEALERMQRYNKARNPKTGNLEVLRGLTTRRAQERDLANGNFPLFY